MYAMEAYVSAAKAQLPFSSSRGFAVALHCVESFPICCQGGAHRCLRVFPRFSSTSINHQYREYTRAAVLGVPNSVAQRPANIWKSPRARENFAGDFEPYRHSRNSAFCSEEWSKRVRLLRFDISRISATCSSTSATAPRDSNSNLVITNDHFQRLENFYDVHGFLFAEENWDMDVAEASNSLEDNPGTLMAAARVEGGSRVLSWGGSPALIHQLSVICPESLVVSHCSLSVLAMIKESNDDIVCWHGDIVDMPSSSYGPFDSVFLNSLLALSEFPGQLLQAIARLCKSGARIVINNSQGKKSLAACREKNPGMVLHDLPDLATLEKMIDGLPLKIVEFQDESSYFLAALEVTNPPALSSSGLNGSADSSATVTSKMRGTRTLDLVPNYPLRVRGHVVTGFGRGSKQMGIPTANVDPEEVPEEVLRLPKGVYCGWAQVHGEGLDSGVHKMAMNIGNRPTFADGGGVTVEVHILHDYGDVDFYGLEVGFIVLGFIREEMQFKSLGELVQRIQTDLEIARNGLDEDDMQQFAADEFFVNR